MHCTGRYDHRSIVAWRGSSHRLLYWRRSLPHLRCRPLFHCHPQEASCVSKKSPWSSCSIAQRPIKMSLLMGVHDKVHNDACVCVCVCVIWVCNGACCTIILCCALFFVFSFVFFGEDKKVMQSKQTIFILCFLSERSECCRTTLPILFVSPSLSLFLFYGKTTVRALMASRRMSFFRR